MIEDQIRLVGLAYGQVLQGEEDWAQGEFMALTDMAKRELIEEISPVGMLTGKFVITSEDIEVFEQLKCL